MKSLLKFCQLSTVICQLFSCLLLFSCSSKKQADTILHHGVVYTVDDKFSVAEAIAVKDGKILAVGTNDDILKQYEAKEVIDLDGKTVFPGFIDAHAHFWGYGMGLQECNLVGTNSWEEITDKLKKFSEENKEGWLVGRGWDQNDWTVKQFPGKEKLDELFPDRPVLLTRVDGHAAIANQKALDISGVEAGDKLTGGEVEVKGGKLTGILIDNATSLVENNIPAPTAKYIKEALIDAQQNCLAVGLTTIDDCGLNYDAVEFIDSLQKRGDLKMRLYVMLSDAAKNYEYIFKKGKIKTDRLNVSSFKVYADGALGSRGACLLQPYSDKPGHYGFLLSRPEHFDSVAKVIYEHNFQMCTHAIGDSGNRTILNIYAKYLKGKNDRRWRIEHAQVINQNDFKLFGENNVLPSVQPTHATSDMYWAADRLGKERVKGAYAYKQLLQQNNILPLGTDFPVEDINPLNTFYAAVARKDKKRFPEDGYQFENALSREEAIKGMTIWAAYSNFEEKQKGSIEVGKLADFVILDKDLLKCAENEILQAKVLFTYVNGQKLYSFR
ncbi:MAG: amidohydrolase [Sphingobacteriales bacterium]|nr:amidohydrolase [Sphingobacteriales bacterium]MBI3719439.1 amidohydrolase [Sphingobacteriales bacterium]